MKHNLLKSVIISVILLMGVSNAWGATNTTVYYAVPTSVVGSYTVKCNVNYKGDGNDWQQHNMTKTDKTYDGYPIYSCTFTDKYNGLGCLQFQLYDGTTHKGQQQPISSWTEASTYNGKLLKHNQDGWNTYRYDQHGFEAANNGIKYYSNLNANDEEWNFNGQSAQTKELGEVTSLYLKEWFVQLYENWTGAQGNIKFQYNIHPTANSAGNYTEITKKWEDPGNWNNGWLYPKYGNNEQNINLLNGLPGSGKYTMSFKYYDSDLKLTSPVHKLNWTYNIVPSVNNFKVTVGENIVSGTGTSGDPYVIAYGKTTTLTVSGNKASTDANSSLYAKFGNNTYSSTLTKNLTPNSTKQSIQVKAKYYNSKDDLSGTEKSTTIYYRAQTFAVNITSSGNGTVTPSGTQQVGATTVSITATPNLGYAFKQWEVTGGAKVANATDASTTLTATAAGTVTAVFEEKPATTIYLEPTNFWNSDNPTYVAHVWKGSTSEDIVMTAVGSAHYSCKVPYGYTNIVFYRKSTDGKNIWNQTNDLTMPTDNKTLYEITSTGTGTTTKADGLWKNATYPITLKSTPYGEFTVKCNNVSHTSSRTKDIVIDLLVGSTIEITQSTSYNDAYNNDLVIKTSNSCEYENAELNTTYTICGATTIQENFTTKTAHVVYLRVPNSKAAAWNSTGTSNYVYSVNNLNTLNEKTGTVIEMTSATDDEIYKETGYTYYKCSIKAGCHTFRFERKTAKDAGAINNTEYFEHLLPLGQSNCFTINNNNGSTFYGDWALGTADGDYRILYVEQQVAHGTDENAWKTVINTTYQHASDIIKKGDGETIVSLHIKYDKTKHPEVILQKFTNGEWVDVEGQAHMVLGPLTASADMAMLPGRRNTEGDVNLRYGDGIEEIKADAEENGKAGRVWNFVVKQSGASAHIDFTAETFAPYEGDYYIRTDNTAGGWMTYAIPGNVMSHSEYSLEHSGYSHYFCKWVDKKDQNDPEDKIYTPNVKFVVANDYGAVISDTIASDIYTDENGTLKADANVRWMWNEYTNIGSRAYIAGSSVSNFLVAKYVSTESQDKTGNFKDKGEWVYEADLTNVQIDDKLTSITATYDEKSQELLEQKFIDENGGLVMLTSTGNARTTYTVRVIYDFKINKTIVYLIPTANDVTTSIDVIIERSNQDEAGEATQVKAAITPANAEGLTVYGLITLTKDHITNPAKSEQAALTYWISFPFDVKIGDITGFGEVGKHWMIKYYDGAERAAKGWFLDSKTFWKFFLDTEDVMKANTGYVLTLNKSLLNASNPVYDNTTILKLYFPSKEKITGEINSGLTKTTVDVPEHLCKITSPADRTIKDSHWNLIGVPSYAHKTNYNKDVKFFYNYDFQKDAYSTEKNEGPNTFYAMHAYMVQYHGTIDWSTFTTAPAQLAAKKNADAEEQYTLRLELQQNGTKADQTFVELHDDATTMFDMNVDLTKMFNASSANIYTLIGSDNQVAANVMPIANTTIPVGVQIAKAGEYTFAMPDGTDGITVELIDYETNTTTNLLLSEYNVSLPAGTFENRFALIVKPNKVATDMETIDDETNGVKKYIIDGKLFLQKDGMLYDAQGHIVR